MNLEHHHKSKSAMSKDSMNLQDQYYLNSIMDVRRSKNNNNPSISYVEVKKIDNYNQKRSSFTKGNHSKKMFRCFTLESMLLLIGLTASLLILPLVVPPLPPPPFLLLLLPIFIMGLLVMLAFMPSGVREATHTYV
ncbi:hypothetical protein ABFS82_07G110600 [Erythranthe guttata]|uniref:protein AUXIN-REGULATED GENE INVOLVED IN ORGAN SIZE-like n=1 Tax=Erythranthe guttata TaxID=4155 RepID=UPI00064E061D|nr:PREDICTED: protein AUXIN-REGULATED GENE INVOLVED IN ORGAN SIZE-like [Erythranthe guttata]|eukprot:XP_012846923.1 PREDICTED: protein AUXIN-REGULATED GENE INVOLVED IN ORGAN SIZE-like [Erythranthe guttata]